MRKRVIRLLVLCMILALTAPLLAQPAWAAEAQAEPYEGTPLFVIGVWDADGKAAAAMNGFLAWDPETDSSFLLGPSVIYDLVQEGYTANILGDDNYFQTAIPVAKENGVAYLYAPGLENAPYLELGTGSRSKAAAVYEEITADGTVEMKRRDFDLSDRWKEGANGFLTYTGSQLDTTYLIGAPMLDVEDGSVLGSVSMSGDQEIMLVPLVQGRLSAGYSIETLSGVSSGSETPATEAPATEAPATEAPTTEKTTTEKPAAEKSGSGKSIPWAAVIVAAGAAGYLYYRNSGKKTEGAKEKEGTMPIQNPTPAALWQLRCVGGTRNGQIFPVGGTLRIGRNPACDISFPENTPGVSGTHCEVSVEGDRVVLRDLNSTYGTYLNSRLEANRSYALHLGDTFTLAEGGPSFRLEKLGEEAEETGPAVRDAAGRTYRADGTGAICFGRGSGNQVRRFADEQSVSGSHCVLYREGGRLYLKDLGSTNGTFFSQQERLKPNTPYRIRPGMAFFLSNPGNTFVVTEE